MTFQNLQDRLDSLLSFLESSAKETGKFVMAQAPAVAKEIIVWNAVKGLLVFVPAALCAACFGVVTAHFLLTAKFTEAMIAFGPCLLGGLVAGCNTNWLKALVAPKLFLIDFLRSSLKP